MIPTTKHHDGVALWDAPGTGTRNTVHRGPRRDLVGEIADAVREAGLRFGVYYSGGLDWGVTDFPPITAPVDFRAWRPKDPAYNVYASLHVRDLVARYSPDVLWNDMNWPDAGKRTGSWSLHELFTDYYAGNRDGVLNDRWGDTHWDFRTSEYQAMSENEAEPGWENCRGIGLSFGYNRAEDERHILTGRRLACHLTDVASRGGRLLLNVGPTADGEIPELQQASLRVARPLDDPNQRRHPGLGALRPSVVEDCVAPDRPLRRIGCARPALPYVGRPGRLRCHEPESRLLGRVRRAAYQRRGRPRRSCAGLHHRAWQRFADPRHRRAGRLGGRPKR